MREGKPSATARIVSFSRGVGLGTLAPDPLAAALLPSGAATLVRASRRAGLRSIIQAASRVATLGLVDHVTLRTLAIDRVVDEAIRGRCRQCVILGAGLDTRAYRLESLRGIPTFEIDHPAMQIEKRRRIDAAKLGRDELRYAPVDFQRDSIAEALGKAGHDPTVPTIWIWEGVTMYLPREATEATMGEISRASAASSQLALTYLVPGEILFGQAGELAVRTLFQALGEPIRGRFSPEALDSLLSSFGFRLDSDSGSTEWARSQGTSPIGPLAYRGERLAVASRRQP